jgi:hypothetical protein
MLRLTPNTLPASEKLLSDIALEAGTARMDRATNPKAGKQAGSPFVPDSDTICHHLSKSKFTLQCRSV